MHWSGDLKCLTGTDSFSCCPTKSPLLPAVLRFSSTQFSQGQSKPKLLKMAQYIQVPLSDLTVLLHEAPQLLYPHSSVLCHSLKWLSWQLAVLNNGIVFQNGTGTTLSNPKLWETGWKAALPVYGCHCYLCALSPAEQQPWGAVGGICLGRASASTLPQRSQEPEERPCWLQRASSQAPDKEMTMQSTYLSQF